MKLIGSAAWVFTAAVCLSGASLSAATMTIKGTVADAMCGAKHMMPTDAAKCTRECVKKGSDYALITTDGKVYTLKADDATKMKLDARAGKTAEVRGDVNGTTLTVASVK
jgi:hypothetical protein